MNIEKGNQVRKLINRWRQSFAVKPMADSLDDLESWFQSALGQAILNDEQKHIDEAVSDLYGFHLLQLGINRDVDISRNSSIQHKFSLTPALKSQQNHSKHSHSPNPKDSPENNKAKVGGTLISALADCEKLPLESESVDVVVLHHALEFSQHPHHLLRETERVVIPRGYTLIVSFNPFSWFGAWKSIARLTSGGKQWRHHSLRLGRVVDWLRLLDFEPVNIQHGFYRWPVDHAGIIGKTQWIEKLFRFTRLPVGAYYVILARKDVVGMTPIRPAWKKFKPIEGLVGSSRFKPAAAGKPMQAKNKHTVH